MRGILHISHTLLLNYYTEGSERETERERDLITAFALARRSHSTLPLSLSLFARFPYLCQPKNRGLKALWQPSTKNFQG